MTAQRERSTGSAPVPDPAAAAPEQALADDGAPSARHTRWVIPYGLDVAAGIAVGQTRALRAEQQPAAAVTALQLRKLHWLGAGWQAV